MAIRDWQGRNDFLSAPRPGGGSLYGGPPLPPPPPPAPAPLSPEQVSAIPDSLTGPERTAALKAAAGWGSNDGGGGVSAGGIGDMLKGGLGTVLGGAAKKLDWVANLGLLGAEELSEAVSGVLGGADEFASQLNADGSKNEFGLQSNWDKLNDPDYGFGKLFDPENTIDRWTGTTSNKWVNRGVGFVGDVAFDPWSYVGGAIVKSPLALGKAGRQAMAQRAAGLGMSDEIVESIGKYHHAYLDDATRAQLGVKKAGVYWGVGDASIHLPLTGGIGRTSEKFFAQVRNNTAGRMVGKVGKGRGEAALALPRRVLTTGKTIDGLTPKVAGQFMNMVDEYSSVAGMTAEPWARRAQATMQSWDDKTRQRVTHEIEAAATTADGKALDLAKLSPEAREWVALRDFIYDSVTESVGADLADAGLGRLNLGNRGPNYIPHRYSKEAWDFFADDQVGQRLLNDLADGATAAKTRVILKDKTVKIKGKDVTFGSATAENIEEVLTAAFPESGVTKWIDDNAVSLMERYISDMSQVQASHSMLQVAIKQGSIGRPEMYSTEMIEGMLNVSKNSDLSKYLKKELVKRKDYEKYLHGEAVRVGKELSEELDAALVRQVDELAAKSKHLKGFAETLKKDIDRHDADGGESLKRIRSQFSAERARIDKMYSTLHDEIVQVDAAMQAINAEQAAIRGARDEAVGYRLAALQKEHAAKTAMLESVGVAALELNDADTMFGVILASAGRLDEVADSPQLIAELASELSERKVISGSKWHIDKDNPVVDEQTMKAYSAAKKELDDLTEEGVFDRTWDEAVQALDDKMARPRMQGNVDAEADYLTDKIATLDTALGLEAEKLKPLVQRLSEKNGRAPVAATAADGTVLGGNRAPFGPPDPRLTEILSSRAETVKRLSRTERKIATREEWLARVAALRSRAQRVQTITARADDPTLTGHGNYPRGAPSITSREGWDHRAELHLLRDQLVQGLADMEDTAVRVVQRAFRGDGGQAITEELATLRNDMSTLQKSIKSADEELAVFYRDDDFESYAFLTGPDSKLTKLRKQKQQAIRLREDLKNFQAPGDTGNWKNNQATSATTVIEGDEGVARIVDRRSLQQNVDYLAKQQQMSKIYYTVTDQGRKEVTERSAVATESELLEKVARLTREVDDNQAVVDSIRERLPRFYQELERGSPGGQPSPEEVKVVRLLLDRLDAGERTAKAEYKKFQDLRRKHYPQAGAKPNKANVDAREWHDTQRALAGMEGIDYDEFLNLQKVNSPNSQRPPTIEEYKAWEELPYEWKAKVPVERRPDHGAVGDGPDATLGIIPIGSSEGNQHLTQSIGSLMDNQRIHLDDRGDLSGAGFATREGGQEIIALQDEARESWQEMQKLTERAKADLGLHDNDIAQWSPDGVYGNVLIFDDGAELGVTKTGRDRKRGLNPDGSPQAMWKGNGVTETEYGLQKRVAEKYGNDFEAFKEANPNSPAKSFYPDEFDKGGIPHQEAATVLGGFAKVFRRDSDEFAKSVRPELADAQMNSAIREVIGRMTEEQRAYLWKSAREEGHTRRKAASVKLQESSRELGQAQEDLARVQGVVSDHAGTAKQLRELVDGPTVQPIEYMTAKGSKYTLATDGSSSRVKAAGAGDITEAGGIQPTFEKVQFLASEDAHNVAAAHQQGYKWKGKDDELIGLVTDDTNLNVKGLKEDMGIRNMSWKEAYEKNGGKVSFYTVEGSTVPARGLQPFEFNGGKSNTIHVGDKITRIDAPRDAGARGDIFDIDIDASKMSHDLDNARVPLRADKEQLEAQANALIDVDAAAVAGQRKALEAAEAEFDPTSTALREDWDALGTHIQFVNDRLEKLKTVRKDTKRLSKLTWGDKTTEKAFLKRLDQFESLLNESVSSGPEMRAASRLFDDYVERVTKLSEFEQGTERFDQLYKKAVAGGKGKEGFNLDMQAAMVNGFQKLDSELFPGMRDMGIDSQLAKMLSNWQSAMRDDLDLKWFDEATQIFKSYATMTPGFHLRNFMGATFMNFSDGVTVKDTRLALRHWRGYVSDPENYIKNLGPEDQHVKDGFQAVFGVGAGGSFDPGEIGKGFGRASKGLKNNRATRKSRALGEDLVEGPVRLAAALNTTRRGGDVSNAMGRVKRLHFDYGDLSSLDQKMKRVIPFYMFMSRNLPLQIEQMWRKPKAYAVYNHFMNNFDQSDENTLMPKYMKDAGAIVFGNSWFGDKSKDAVFMPDLQHNNLMQDVMSFSNPVDGLLSSGNPIATKPLEIALNRSGFRGGEAFFNKEQDEYGNWEEKDWQRKALERIMYGAEGVFTPLASIQGLTGYDVLGGDEQERAEDRQMQKSLNYIGVPLKQIGDREREYERRRRQKEDAA